MPTAAEVRADEEFGSRQAYAPQLDDALQIGDLEIAADYLVFAMPASLLRRVPIVPAVALFDLSFGRADRRPDAAMGYAAAACASEGDTAEGNAGAGMGATVGKLFGMDRAMKSGIGCWTVDMGRNGGIRVAALTANNALGDVRDLETGRILAGARTGENAREFTGTAACWQGGYSREKFAQRCIRVRVR